MPGNPDRGCWTPKSFDKAIIVVIDALRYDFTIPWEPQSGSEEGAQAARHFHNALPVLYETAVNSPANAFLRPFIADPPTTTLQRLKGLTTGTLPTFIDAGSNFAGTAIDEDNLVAQLYTAGRRVVHLGDDTWHALFPGLFEPNLTRAYDSFNVWDLHTVDNGVNEHLFPLLEQSGQGSAWDVVIAHYLGVDHAGHRYGPDHPAMADKLRQMDGVIRNLIAALDDDTLLVVLGDHGMDVKGDHGGESDDEVSAALWMYSKRAFFGRRDASAAVAAKPPATAKEHPVAQIDLVPTLALLLGLPIPFNNLGWPIEEAFKPTASQDLATVGRITAAQIHRYQAAYSRARGLSETATAPTDPLWQTADAAWKAGVSAEKKARAAYEAYAAYQRETLRIAKHLWARFDLVRMGQGIAALVGTFALIAVYAQGVAGDHAALTPPLLGWGIIGTSLGGAVGAALGFALPEIAGEPGPLAAFGAALGGITATLVGLWPARELLVWPVPTTFWGWWCVAVTALLGVGFASNSFVIWEDEQLLFLLTTFGVLMLASSLGRPDAYDRNLGATNAISFLVATRLSAMSRLCREEQMPNCRSSYYASATSSTSANWQLVIPYLVALALPTAIRYFYVRTKNYHGSAVIWIGIALRVGLALVATFWTLDAADDAEWFTSISKETLKTIRVIIAQVVLAVAFAAGYSTYIWAAPMLAVKTEEATEQPASAPSAAASTISKPLPDGSPNAPILTTMRAGPAPPAAPRSKLIIYGYANIHGTRYFLLPAAWVLALLLVQKPMGQGALALCTISILNILELVDAHALRHSPVGPIVLALLGGFHFFKTGHQAALVTIQWEAAFIPLRAVQYPWSPLLVVLNTFGPQLLCALAVPALALWKVPPKRPFLLGRIAALQATHLLFYAALALATVVEAAWLRRHLMLYRVFMPRMLTALAALLVVEVVSALVALVGVRWSVVSVAEVLGWPDEEVVQSAPPPATGTGKKAGGK